LALGRNLTNGLNVRNVPLELYGNFVRGVAIGHNDEGLAVGEFYVVVEHFSTAFLSWVNYSIFRKPSQVETGFFGVVLVTSQMSEFFSGLFKFLPGPKLVDLA